MGPQCEDGYTRIANELLEALSRIRIPGESMQIFLVILRKTYGYGKKSDMISLSQFQETGISKPHVIRAIKHLVNLNIIVAEKGNKIITTFSINKHFSEWKPLPKKETLPKKEMTVAIIGNDVAEKGNNRCPKRNPQKKKETITKETITKESASLLPICKTWKAFVEMRIKIKKPMTPFAMELRVKELFTLQSQGEDPIKVLEQSIGASWQGLFPVKNDTSWMDNL